MKNEERPLTKEELIETREESTKTINLLIDTMFDTIKNMFIVHERINKQIENYK